MVRIAIRLKKEKDGSVRSTLCLAEERLEHVATEPAVKALLTAAAKLAHSFESGKTPLADPVVLNDLGRQLKDCLLGPLWQRLENQVSCSEGTIHLSTPEAELLNLPWELLPSANSAFLVADGRWTIRRTTREDALHPPALGQVALPLRILFAACAPIDQTGLDYEREEEAMLRLATKLGNRVHLSIAEAATFEELRDLISELKPHVVHLSGHGIVLDGIGYFTFEDERGRSDLRDARSMAEQLFAGRGVRAVFVSGCQSAQAASAGVCQALTADGHVPVALGWGASVADGLATDFARVFYHELAAGRSLDASVAAARRELYAEAQVTVDDEVYFNATFALPQLFASDATNDFINEALPREKVPHPGVRYELLGDNIIGLKEGFVGRRRLLQRLRPGLRDGDFNVLLLTGMGGAGKSTLATRLANRCLQEGYHLAALKAGRHESQTFALRLVQEISIACQRLGRSSDYSLLNDGNQPLPIRLRLAVEILNEAKILLVLDNLEDLMPLPPSAPRWLSEELAAFFRELFGRLTGAGRCILTCRYLPEGFDPDQANLAHEPLPDFSEAEFIKCLSRNECVVQRMASGEITSNLLYLLHRKIGGPPRFIKLAADVLATVDTAKLEERLNSAPEADGDDALGELREKYLNDIFLPELYQALTPPHRLALSRLALVELPVPLDGLAMIGGLAQDEAEAAIAAMLSRGMLQKLGEEHEAALYAIYPLQRQFLTHSDRLTDDLANETHRAAAAFFGACYRSDREEELRLSFMAELFACREHAERCGEFDRLAWATLTICGYLCQNAEFRTAAVLLAPMVNESASPKILKLLADCRENLSQWPEARSLYIRAIAAFGALGDRVGESAAWHNLATLDVKEGDYVAAREKFDRSLEMVSAADSQEGAASSWCNLAIIDVHEGKYAFAREKLAHAIQILSENADSKAEAGALHQIASIDLLEGCYVDAREKFGRCLKIQQTIDHHQGEAASWHSLATLDLHEGLLSEAREKFARSLEIRQMIGDLAGESATLHNLASLDVLERQYASAEKKFARSLEIRRAIGNRLGEAATLHQMASLDLIKGKSVEACKKLGISLNITQALGNRAGEAKALSMIGSVAWEKDQKALGLRLHAIAHGLQKAIGASEHTKTWTTVTGMASQLQLSQEEFDAMIEDAAHSYRADRGAPLVIQAFEALV